MKTKIMRIGIRVMVMAFSFISTMALGNEGDKSPSVAQLKYLGDINNDPVFQLDLNNENQNEFLISIKDQFGEVLYAERIKTKNITRKFQLDTENLEGARLRVEVRTGNNNKPEIFTISRTTRFVEETNISQL